MAKDQAGKTKNDMYEGSVAVAESPKAGEGPPTSWGGGGESIPADAVNATVQLFCSSNTPQSWKEVRSITAIVGDPWGNRGCPQEIQCFRPSRQDYLEFCVSLPAGRIVSLEFGVTYSDTKTPVWCEPLLTSVQCGGGAAIKHLLPEIPVASVLQKTSKLVIHAQWSSKKDGRWERTGPVEIASVNAKLLSIGNAVADTSPATNNETLPPPTLQGSTALIELSRGGTYKLDVRIKERYASVHPKMHHLFCACGDSAELTVYFEPCERVVALFFVNSCGQPVAATSVFQEGDVTPLNISEGGACSFHPGKVGSVRLSCQDYDLRPSEILVDERMHQAHVIEAVKKTRLLAGHSENISLELEEAIKPGVEAIFRILKTDGTFIEKLNAASGMVNYSAPTDYPILIEAVVDGIPVGRKTHYPTGWS
jgi:hypothetical protein